MRQRLCASVAPAAARNAVGRRAFHHQRQQQELIIPCTQVTRKNFSGLLATIRLHIQQADFLALHTTLTGFHSAPWRSCHAFDTLDTWYHKLKDSAQRFAMLQFGLCTFQWCSSQRRFNARPYNFLLFPRNDLKVKLEGDAFLCQTASLEDLANCGFDLNLWIQDGLSYMSKEEVSMSKKRITFESEDIAALHMFTKPRYSHRRSVKRNHVDMLIFEEFKSKLTNWLATLERPRAHKSTANNLFQRDKLVTSSIIWYNSCESLQLVYPSLKLEALGQHDLLILSEVIHGEFDELVVVVQPESLCNMHKSVCVFYMASDNEKDILLADLEKLQNASTERQIVKAVGFRHIIDAIVDSKKVIVGHECIHGFAHIYKSCLKTLPINAANFAAGLSKSFSCIYDTKYLMKKILPYEANLSLDEVYRKLLCEFSHVVKVEAHIQKGDHSNQCTSVGRATELQPKMETCNAGKVAYMVGCLFAHVSGLTSVEPSKIGQLASDVKVGLGRYANLLCMNSVTSSVLDLSTGCECRGDHVLSSQRLPLTNANVVLIWGYPSGTSLASVQSFIEKVVSFGHHFDVFVIDDSSVFLKLSCPEATEMFFTLLGSLPQKSSFLRAGRFSAYEFICKSSPLTVRLADSAEYLQIGSYGS